MLIGFAALVPFIIVSCGWGGGGGTDPGTLKLYIDPVQFEGLTSLNLHITRVEVVIADDPAGQGEILVVNNEPDTANLVGFASVTNEGLNIDKDARLWIPAEIDRPNLITVGATDHKDSIASFSNFGSTSVDLTAPGVNILSTTRGGGAGYMSGTSMATPHVAGVAALVLSRYPALIGNPGALMNRIEAGVDAVAGHGNIRTGGRLNAYNAVY